MIDAEPMRRCGSRPLHARITGAPAPSRVKTGMKHTVIALLLSIGLLAPGCAHGGATSGPHQLSNAATLVLVGLAVAGTVALFTAAEEGSPQCTDPLGRCGSYDLPPPESR